MPAAILSSCWSDLAESPLAAEACGALYYVFRIEARRSTVSPPSSGARSAKERIRPLTGALEGGCAPNAPGFRVTAEIAKCHGLLLKRWPAVSTGVRFSTTAASGLSNNAVERALRGMRSASGRRRAGLLRRSDRGPVRASGAMDTLLATRKTSTRPDPQAWLADGCAAGADHPAVPLHGCCPGTGSYAKSRRVPPDHLAITLVPMLTALRAHLHTSTPM